MKATLRFNGTGEIDCLYTEAIDLRALGHLAIERATDIRFDPGSQQWEVHDASDDGGLFSHASRQVCLQWEQDNLQPGCAPGQ